MKKYPKMKPSGVEWIGDVPEHWEVKRLAFVGRFSKGGGISRSELTEVGLPAILYGDIYTKYSIQVKKVVNSIAEETAKKSVAINQGTLLFTGSGETKEDIGRCVVYLGEAVAYAGGDVIIFEQTDNDSLFLSYFLNTNGANCEKARYSKGDIVVHTYASSLRNLAISLPSPSEQTSISNYLDRKTAQIDQAISEKERLIELFREERQAIINHAVTKGIRAGVKMKASGVEWIGDVPEGWTVKRLKHVVQKIGSGVTPKGGSEVYQTEGIPLLRSQNIHFHGLYLDDVAFITEDVHNSMSNSRVLNGDVLLNITGASIGRCYFYEGQFEEANVNQHVCILRPNEKTQTKYLHFYLSSEIGQLQIELAQTGSGREGLNFESLKKFILPLPPFDEQTEIIKVTNKKTAQIDSAISGIQQEIALLQEYRQALIFEAVTGKICVIN